MSGPLAKGSFLVATPALSDPNFARAVILLCDHGAGGAMGLIVNRPLSVPLTDILSDDFSLPLPEAGGPRVHQGGPVQQDHLLFLHGLGKPGLDTHPVCEGVWLGGDPEVLKKVLATSKAPPFLRCYLGYAGWGAGQLESELEEGAWVLRPGKPQDVFALDASILWGRLLGSPARPDPFRGPRGHDLN